MPPVCEQTATGHSGFRLRFLPTQVGLGRHGGANSFTKRSQNCAAFCRTLFRLRYIRDYLQLIINYPAKPEIHPSFLTSRRPSFLFISHPHFIFLHNYLE